MQNIRYKIHEDINPFCKVNCKRKVTAGHGIPMRDTTRVLDNIRVQGTSGTKIGCWTPRLSVIGTMRTRGKPLGSA